MIATPLRLTAVLLLLAGCTSTPDEAPNSSSTGVTAPAAAGAGSGGGAGSSGGIGSSDLAGQPAPGTQQDLEVAVGDRVFFAYDSAVLSPVAIETLDRQGAWLQQYPDVIVTVEGHADERGTREYNLALGDRRATAVRNYLMALNVTSERILTISYGEERPADSANDDTAWAKNRRVVAVVSTVN